MINVFLKLLITVFFWVISIFKEVLINFRIKDYRIYTKLDRRWPRSFSSFEFTHILRFLAEFHNNCVFLNSHWTKLVGYSKIEAYDRPGTVQIMAVPSKLKPGLHMIGSDRYLPHVTEAGTGVSPVRIHINLSPLWIAHQNQEHWALSSYDENVWRGEGQIYW